MADDYVDQDILKMVADGLLDDYKEAGETFTPEREDEFRAFVAGLVNAEPPPNEQIWETVEVLLKTIDGRDRDLALRAASVFLLQFVSGVDHSPEAFQCLLTLNKVKDEVKAEHFREARELLMAFLNRARAVARSMETAG
jgi:hypothetical protein